MEPGIYNQKTDHDEASPHAQGGAYGPIHNNIMYGFTLKIMENTRTSIYTCTQYKTA